MVCAAVAFVLGGEVAAPGGECAPEDSSGFWANGETNGPGSWQAAVDTGVGAVLPAAFSSFR